jgi:hypothetical protein
MDITDKGGCTIGLWEEKLKRLQKKGSQISEQTLKGLKEKTKDERVTNCSKLDRVSSIRTLASDRATSVPPERQCALHGGTTVSLFLSLPLGG